MQVQDFIGKATKTDYVTNMVTISASVCKQQTCLKMHVFWDVMLCCSPNDVAAHLLTLATLPTPL
jgi:hypothetical protein